MSGAALAVAVIALLGWLALNLVGVSQEARERGWRGLARQALAWCAIIAGLALLVSMLKA